jgi:hypothetical protein
MLLPLPLPLPLLPLLVLQQMVDNPTVHWRRFDLVQ